MTSDYQRHKEMVNRAASWAAKTYPRGWCDMVTDMSTPRIWRYVPADEVIYGHGLSSDRSLLVLRESGGDTCQPRYYWGHTITRTEVKALKLPGGDANYRLPVCTGFSKS